ncbi:hypothetical protein MRX96_008474 [Rhipicephalus microplus]
MRPMRFFVSDSAYILLTCPDAELREMALEDAHSFVTDRFGCEVTCDELEAHIEGSFPDNVRASVTRLWSV